MANDLALFDPKQMQVPAHLLNDDDWGSNTTAPQTVPSLLYTGKVWTISMNGEKVPLMKRDSDGDEVPMAVLRVIILDYAKSRGRAYYEGAYDPNAVSAPICWSTDGVAPADSVTDKQAKTCASCKWAVKGSKITEQGKETAACGQHRMLVVVPAHKPDMQPLRLKIAITSDWDKSEELAAQNYFAFQQYNNFLNGRGVNHTAKVVTKMRFDPAPAYPKVIFSPDRWITAEEAAAIKPRLGSKEVLDLLGDAYTPAGGDGVPTRPLTSPAPATALDDDEVDGSAAQAAAAAAQAAAEKAAAAKAAKAAKAAAEKAAAEKAAKAAAAKAPALADDDEPAPPKAAKGAVPADVASVLADWGDE